MVGSETWRPILQPDDAKQIAALSREKIEKAKAILVRIEKLQPLAFRVTDIDDELDGTVSSPAPSRLWNTNSIELSVRQVSP